ncbi:hypothetical protein [Ferroplasma sp.]|jgi:hypothetical protein|uniref:hypothetical protein n=1 Tax=Ferroplasma sp. TaxID=2591003 RepID=UPI0026292157|nr:hypothetical protein [Ferroplasma sp.]
MTDRVEDRDGSYRWSQECPDRYEITLHFRNGMTYDVPKYVKKTICSGAEFNNKTLIDYIWSKPGELEGILSNQSLEELVDVNIIDKNDYMEQTFERLVDHSVRKYMNHNLKPKSNVNQLRKPESEGHISIKNDVVKFLRSIGVEAYPEIVFYENASSDFYEWQKQERRMKPDADGVFGYGSVGFGNYKQKYGQQIKVDVAGWIDDSVGKFAYPIIAVEVMKTSNLREEITGLNKIHGLSVVYTVVVDALGQLNGEINGIPVVSFDVFKSGVINRIEKVKGAIKDGKKSNEIFEMGKKFNTGKLT